MFLISGIFCTALQYFTSYPKTEQIVLETKINMSNAQHRTLRCKFWILYINRPYKQPRLWSDFLNLSKSLLVPDSSYLTLCRYRPKIIDPLADNNNMNNNYHYWANNWHKGRILYDKRAIKFVKEDISFELISNRLENDTKFVECQVNKGVRSSGHIMRTHLHIIPRKSRVQA